MLWRRSTGGPWIPRAFLRVSNSAQTVLQRRLSYHRREVGEVLPHDVRLRRMSHIIFHDTPTLKRPVLIAAFAGWNDAGRAATMAASISSPRGRLPASPS